MTGTKWAFAILVLAGVGAARTSSAQDTGEIKYERPLAAARKSPEIGVGFGFSRGTGNLTRRFDDSTSNVAGSGGEFVLEGGYRINARWMIGLYSAYSRFQEPANGGVNMSVHGANAGIQAQFHFRPMTRVDPWIGLGSGYRGLYQVPDVGSTAALHGFQFARARVGVDFRASSAVAVGPVLGLDATVFGLERSSADGVTRNLGSDTWTVTPFFFAGVAGRFDIVNERELPAERSYAMRR